MIVSIHQPQYLPWLGYFDKIDRSDIFVFLDDVQYKKNEWQNRNKIKTKKNWQWITLPVLYKFGQKISEVLINNTVNWKRKHWTALLTNYSKAKYFKEYKDFFEDTYNRNWNYLVDINIDIISYLIGALGIRTQLVRASEFKLGGKGSAHLVDICKKLGADRYLSGMGGRDYLQLEEFEKSKIKVIFQDFQHPVYSQLYEKNTGFISHMSIVDLLFNYGKDSLAVLKR